MCINKKINRVSFTFFLFCLSHFLMGQSISVSGTITDEYKQGLPGVTVKEINGKATSTTDLEGFYKIQVESDDSQLEFSFIGYKKHPVAVKLKKIVDAIKIKEIIAALTLTAIVRTLIGMVPAALLAIPLFGVSIFKIGLPLISLLLSLYIFGITLGLLVTSGLIRFGPSFENIAWASLFFLAPLGCIYYPIEILPEWLQIIAKILPLVHIFEEMRNILINDTFKISSIFIAFIISLIYFVLGVIIFYIAYFGARERGTLINMGE